LTSPSEPEREKKQVTTNPLQQDKEVENDKTPHSMYVAPVHNRNVPLIRLSTVRILPKADVQKEDKDRETVSKGKEQNRVVECIF
jgi:hypothetical protein